MSKDINKLLECLLYATHYAVHHIAMPVIVSNDLKSMLFCIFLLPMRRTKFTEVKKQVQGHAASLWQQQGQGAGALDWSECPATELYCLCLSFILRTKAQCGLRKHNDNQFLSNGLEQHTLFFCEGGGGAAAFSI